MKQVEVENG